MLAAVCLLAATATLPAVPNWNVFYPYCRLVSVFGGKYFPNRSSLFVFILFTEMVACVAALFPRIVVCAVVLYSNYKLRLGQCKV